MYKIRNERWEIALLEYHLEEKSIDSIRYSVDSLV